MNIDIDNKCFVFKIVLIIKQHEIIINAIKQVELNHIYTVHQTMLIFTENCWKIGENFLVLRNYQTLFKQY